jgi:hypothetical protein
MPPMPPMLLMLPMLAMGFASSPFAEWLPYKTQ